MTTTKKTAGWFRVYLVNFQTLGAMCGYGEGRTLKEAQEDALRLARERDQHAYLSRDGWEVRFAGGINC